jgi:hypothetical protein
MREELELKGLFNSLAENRTPKGRAYAMQNADVDLGVLKLGPRYAKIGERSSAHSGDVGWGLGYGKFATNETQRLTVTGGPTGGTVKLAWTDPNANAATSGDIPYNATAEQLYDILIAMSNLDQGDLTITGGPWPTYPIDVTFKGRFGRTDVSAITLNTNSLTGGTTPSVTISEKVKGGSQEEYIVIVQKNGETTATAYKVTSSDGFTTTTWTEIATGLTASAWHFVQYRDRIYAANATDGLTYKQLGGAWKGSLGTPAFGNPTQAPSLSGGSFVPDMISTGSAGNFSGWGSNPTVTFVNGSIKIVLAADLSNEVVSFDWTFTNAEDWSRQDLCQLNYFAVLSDNELDANSLELELINDDGSPLTITPEAISDGSYEETTAHTFARRHFHFGASNRDDRDNIKKLRLTLRVVDGTNTKTIWLTPLKYQVWVNDRMSSININASRKASIEYAYSYYDVSDDAESRLSPILETPTFPLGSINGCWVGLIAPGNASLTTSDYVRFYRKDEFGQWRALGQVANVTSGNTTVFLDKNMHDDLDLLDVYGVVELPGGARPESLGLFKQCLVVGADQKLWISAVGRPLVFAHDPEDLSAPLPDTNDPNRARTVFMSDNRAEDVYGIVGQDSMYSVSPLSSYAMVGDKPAGLSVPRRLPGSRGSVSYRSTYHFGGGVLNGSQDGLWYYSVGRGFSGEDNGAMLEREETVDVRRSWITTLLGSSYSGLVVVEHNNEVWIFNGYKFLRSTRNRNWNEGTFADSVYAAHASRERGLTFVSSRGQLMKVGSTYTDDAGTAATWEYETGILDGPPIKIHTIEVHCQGRPRISVTVYDGVNSPREPFIFDTPADGQIHRFPCVIQPGYRFKFAFSGDADDVIESIAFHFEGTPLRKGN